MNSEDRLLLKITWDEIQESINEAIDDIREATERLAKAQRARDDHIKYIFLELRNDA